MDKDLPKKQDQESLSQLPTEQLVNMIIEQAIVIQELQADVKELKQEIEGLRISRDLNSKVSSKRKDSGSQ